MSPLLPLGPAEQPWHSSQYPSLPEIYVQNASLEIAWSRVVFEGRTIAGNVVMPFLTTDDEGFDVNSEYDWQLAEYRVQQGQARLPHVSQPAYTE
jgi:N-acylneuraminate cytidylyltransferase